jgi:hypothetical protein
MSPEALAVLSCGVYKTFKLTGLIVSGYSKILELKQELRSVVLNFQ